MSGAEYGTFCARTASRRIVYARRMMYIFASSHHDSRLEQIHLSGSCSLWVDNVSDRIAAVNLHLNDENADFTILHWRYVFKLFRVFLPPEHLYSWIESICRIVSAGADHRPPARIADHPVVFVCVISCTKHHASGAVGNLFDHLSKHLQIVRS